MNKLDRVDMDYIKLKEVDIIIGTPVPCDCFDKYGILLLRKGQIIESKRQLETLLERGLFHIEYRGDISSPQPSASAIESPFKVLQEIQHNLETLYADAVDGTGDKFYDRILVLCKKIQQACEQDTNATIGNIFLSKEYKYTIRHPVNVAIVCEIISKQLKWTDEDRVPLLTAALTMNIGMLTLQDKLYSQESPLTAEQRQSIHEHPERALELLSRLRISDKVWIDGVHYHHEAMDGSGYPSGLRGYAIPLCARVLAVGDRYCAGVSGRSYRLSLTSQEAMRGIYVNAGKKSDPDIVNLCVKLLGIYPPGTFVRLANREIGVVTRRGEKVHTPFVSSLIKSNNKEMFLRPKERDCSIDEFSIVNIINSDQVKIQVNPYQLWGSAPSE